MKKSFILQVTVFLLCFPFTLLVAQEVTFGMVTDTHYAEIPDNGSRTYSQSLGKLQECVDTMNHCKVDFLIELGDFKDMSQPADEQQTLSFLQKAENMFGLFKGRRFHVLGNHDEDCISKQQFLSIAHNSRSGNKKTWYSFNSGGFHFIVLDANFDSTGKDFDHGRFDWGDPNIPPEELNWLREDLHTTMNPVIVFTHQLLDGQGPYVVKNAKEVRKMLESSGKVKCVFQGHYHEGRYSKTNDIHYYTLRCLVDGKSPEGNSFAIVTATKDMISIKGYKRAVSLNLPINVTIATDDYRNEGDYDWEPREEQ